MDTHVHPSDYDADSPTIRRQVIVTKRFIGFAIKVGGVLALFYSLLALPLHLLASQPIDSPQIRESQIDVAAAYSFRQQNRGISEASETTAVITVTVKAQPASRQDFRFHGDLGNFSLDQATPDDGDPVTEAVTFTVAPGVYAITQETPQSWLLSAISCSPRALGQINLPTGKVTLTVQASERVQCTFVNERGVTVRTRTYQDHNGNRNHTLGEPYLPGWAVTLYREVNVLIGTQLTNQYGKANFNYLPPGEYTACQSTAAGWSNSQPGLADIAYAAPCYTFSLRAGEITTLWFGNQQAGDATPEQQPTNPRAIAIAQGADVATDASGYAGWQFVDTDLAQNERGPAIFLPLALAP